jgi:protein-tyrosine phosphatase
MAGEFRILVVCTANVCRSPLAEIVLRRGLAGQHSEFVDVTSAGTHADAGQPMCAQGAAHAGVDPDVHRSRLLSAVDLADADLVLTADRSQRAAAARLDPSCRPRLFTLRQAAELAAHVSRTLAAGGVPEGAPPIPNEAAERLRWFMGEMDVARGSRAGRHEQDDDIEDRHGPGDHAATVAAVDDASASIARGLKAFLWS